MVQKLFFINLFFIMNWEKSYYVLCKSYFLLGCLFSFLLYFHICYNYFTTLYVVYLFNYQIRYSIIIFNILIICYFECSNGIELNLLVMMKLNTDMRIGNLLDLFFASSFYYLYDRKMKFAQINYVYVVEMLLFVITSRVDILQLFTTTFN